LRLNRIVTLSFVTVCLCAGVVWARGGIDADLPTSATAACFSRCEGDVNVKGVEGDVTVTNVSATQTVMLSATVKVQCNGSDVPGATQSLGPASTGPGGSQTFPYSIPLTPVGGCAYTVVAEGISSIITPHNVKTVPFDFNNCPDQPCATGGCTLTLGFWKTHPDNWPVASLTLGTVNYNQTQLLSILNQSVRGNGLVLLAHQLIAAKLNVANGATCASVVASIAAADALIGGLIVPPVGAGSLSTSAVSSLATALDNFNNGLVAGCPGHCSTE
jgi:hypothetical protein